MAQAGSPRVSPAFAGQTRAARSPSPSHQPPSKNQRRRNALAEKLADMTANFSKDHMVHYYAQLCAIQCDINMVMRADPYAGPLEDSPQAISELVSDARQEVCRNRTIKPEAEDSFNALAGRQYANFVDEINKIMEERDRDLTMLYNKHNDSLAELHRTNAYKTELAHQEHALLINTQRERLIANVTARKARLLKDKEQLDIADSNALLLNPTQFSLGNPASPGGAANNRKTRNTRMRPGDTEEVANAAINEDRMKRKRKAIFEDPDESPGPVGRLPDTISSNGWKDARSKASQSQFEAPLYSVDRLFTEKELTMYLNRAHLATSEHFARVKAQSGMNVASTTDGITNGSIDDGDGGVAGGLENGDIDSDRPGSPTSMFPSASQTHHATRSTQRSNPLTDLANAATSLGPFAAAISATASKSNPAAPTPPGLTEAEIANDLALMARDHNDPVIQRILETATEKDRPLDIGTLRTIPGEAEEISQTAENSFGHMAAALAMARSGSGLGIGLGGVPMSKTSSMGGMSDVGAPLGGASMRRTASAADHAARRRGY